MGALALAASCVPSGDPQAANGSNSGGAVSSSSSAGSASSQGGGGSSGGAAGSTSSSAGGGSGAASSSAGSSAGGGASSSSGTVACSLDAPAGAPRVRLLTRAEYDNTIRDLLGDATRPASSFPPENQSLHLDNNADLHQVSPVLLERLMTAAEDVAARALAERRTLLIPCDETVVPPSTCGSLFIANVAPAAFRRPPTPGETQSLQALFDAALGTWDFDTAVRLTLQAILQAPQFLYRLDLVNGETATAMDVELAGGFELATRLSYFLWATMPDPVLFEAARTAQLSTPEQVNAQVQRMLADHRAHQGMRNFFRQWLRTDALGAVNKDTTTFPRFTAELRASWEEGVHAFVEQVVWEGQGTLTELLTRPSMMVDQRLGALYGTTEPVAGFAEVTQPGERAGILTQPGMMAMLAHPKISAPVRRGLFIREAFMCEKLPDPPPGVNTTPPDPQPGLSTRDHATQHMEDPICYSCHGAMDPIGFGLENYDAMGAYRSSDMGVPVDPSGEILWPETDLDLEGPFTGPAQLGQRLAGSPQVRRCVVRNVFRYAMGRLDTARDACVIDALQQAFDAGGGKFTDLVTAVATSRAFRTAALTPTGGP